MGLLFSFQCNTFQPDLQGPEIRVIIKKNDEKETETMLLAIDVGNSNTSVGLFDKEKKLRFLASLDTDSRKTADQISIDLMNLFALYKYRYTVVTGSIL